MTITAPRQLGLDPSWQPSPALRAWMNQVATGINSGAYVPLTTTGALVYDSGTAAKEASAVLEARSTTRGFLPPRLTNAQRTGIASPADGLIVYDTSSSRMYYYSGGAWRQFAFI